MKNLLFEQYGYYPKHLDDNTFNIDGWIFKIVETDISKEMLMAIEEYTKILNDTFNNKGPFIIKNKSNDIVTKFNDRYYVLISSFSSNMSFNDLLKFHFLFYKEDEYIELDKILLVWKERVDNIERKLSSYLRVDSIHYKYNLDIAMFAIGLAINAMQYLSEAMYNYDKKMYGVSIVHKRLYNLNSIDFFNPFNFIAEHPLKDIVLLYQGDYISFEEFKNLLSNYKMDILNATFCISRLLYRVDIFDFLETKRDLDSEQKINFNIKKEMYKIKKAYIYFKEIYAIRPIDWLE